MISIPCSLSFAKLVMMSSAPAKSAGDATPKFHSFAYYSIKSRLQSVLGVRSFYAERNKVLGKLSFLLQKYTVPIYSHDSTTGVGVQLEL